MRSFSLPLPTLFAGFVAVLVGYASSAAIIWQAAAAACGATPGRSLSWMTALGLAMGISTLALSAWRKVPVLTAWSTPGAALLVSGLQGVTLAEAVGIFIFANALIVICGATKPVCPADEDHSPFAGRRDAGWDPATVWFAGLRKLTGSSAAVRRDARRLAAV